ncbi:MAG: F-type H+-transporting ATPase subunit epsilon [Alphaproteobacteria bacterium]|jgi:F-type H+-transporting ATPase subunit epsilon|nr:F-type H+-transporting ATPase subunit epsilon [Alphaproteobacteria bacterium]
MTTFHFDLVAPDKLLFSGEVDQVDVPGAEGDFGVLAGHAPLVATLKPGILVVHEGGQKRRIVVTGGFAEVNPQGLTILADVATSVEDIDRTAITAQIREIEESVKEMEQGTALDRAIARLDHFKALDTHLQGTAMH